MKNLIKALLALSLLFMAVSCSQSVKGKPKLPTVNYVFELDGGNLYKDYRNNISAVYISGSFNNYSTNLNPMKKEGGVYKCAVELPYPSDYVYSFIIYTTNKDTSPVWIYDSANPNLAINRSGGFDSILRLDGDGRNIPVTNYVKVGESKHFIYYKCIKDKAGYLKAVESYTEGLYKEITEYLKLVDRDDKVIVYLTDFERMNRPSSMNINPYNSIIMNFNYISNRIRSGFENSLPLLFLESPSVFWNEGLSSYMGNYKFNRSIDEYKPIPVECYIKEFINKGLLTNLSNIIYDPSMFVFMRDGIKTYISYLTSISFTKYVLERFGAEKYKKLCLGGDFKAVTGIGLEKIEKDWRKEISEYPVNDVFKDYVELDIYLSLNFRDIKKELRNKCYQLHAKFKNTLGVENGETVVADEESARAIITEFKSMLGLENAD